ncbi:MAG: hypothetical protein HY272_01885 [Gammaproteobacteria bacterium]|nr:hypothetical protein [Gammaproteobacteria bacterium]
MHWADIYSLMVKAGWPPSKMAKYLKVQPSAISQVIRDQHRSHKIASFISKVTNTPLHRLFPNGRYDTPSKRGAAA